MNQLAKELSQYLTQPDDEVDFRIQSGIEMYRKGWAKLNIVNAKGEAVKNAAVNYKQLDHDYLFGCNAFMINQFKSIEQNRQYEETFAKVFNHAVIPFYWSDLEPEDGKVRFAAGSKPDIYRRPPPDEVLDFCKRKNITPKGHPLCWHLYHPVWTPRDSALLMERLEQRISEIAARYGKSIKIWDCVNETLTRYPLARNDVPAYPDDYAEQAFHIAQRYLPHAKLICNDDNKWWNFQGDYSPVYMLLDRLKEHGCNVGGLGLQYHMFQHLLAEADLFMNPRVILKMLDLYAKLKVPVNFSEVSIISRRDLGDGDLFQELVTEKLYKLWFSHPVTDSIVWWNLVDGTAAGAPAGSEDGENSLRAGLVNYDFTPKAAYRALDKLINHEWRTNGKLEYADGEANQIHGFFGRYELEVATDTGKVKTEIHLHKNSPNIFTVNVK